MKLQLIIEAGKNEGVVMPVQPSRLLLYTPQQLQDHLDAPATTPAKISPRAFLINRTLEKAGPPAVKVVSNGLPALRQPNTDIVLFGKSGK